MIDVGSIFSRLWLKDEFTATMVKATKSMEGLSQQASQVAGAFAPVTLAIAGAGAGASIACTKFAI